MAAEIQFIRGVEEPSTPEVKLTQSRDKTNGTATFIFGEPSIFEASSDLGDITGNDRISLEKSQVKLDKVGLPCL